VPGHWNDNGRLSKALKRGGEDSPSNVQWQSVDEARAKDRLERTGAIM